MPPIVVVQPAVPAYRVGFFDRLAEMNNGDFVVHASPGNLGVLTERSSRRAWERTLGPLRRLLPGLEWQVGALSIPIQRGDVLVVSGAPRTLSNIALLLKAKINGVRTIWWGHYWSSTSKPWRAGLRMILMKLADAVLFYTDQEVGEYHATRKRSRKPVMALNNGIETTEIEMLREPYDPAMRRRDLLFIGRLTEKSGLPLLLDALAAPGLGAVTLDVIGSGSSSEEGALRELADNLAIADRVAWHGGTTDERQIAEIANQCKAFVYPGSVGLSLIHAFTYGLPAIVHDDRWRHMPEIAALRVGENGLCFRAGDVSSLAETILTMLINPTRLVGMSAASIATTERTFNTADMARRFQRIVAEVVSAGEMTPTDSARP